MTLLLFGWSPAPNPDPSAWFGNDHYEVIVEDESRTRLAQLATVKLTEVEEVLNAQGHTTLTYSAFDPNIATLLDNGEHRVLDRSLVVYFNNVAIQRCPIVDVDVAPNGDITPQLPDQWFWFGRRVFGQANRPTQFPDTEWVWPDGDSHPTHWNNANCAPVRQPIAPSVSGPPWQVMIPAPVDYGPGAYLNATIFPTPTEFPQGLIYVVTAFFKLQYNLDGSLATFFDGRVIEVNRWNSDADRLDPSVDPADYQYQDVTGASAPDDSGWQEVSVPIWIPPESVSAHPVIDVNLMAPIDGEVTWAGDDLYPTLTRDVTFATGASGEDIAIICRRVIDYAQDPAHGKSYLGIIPFCAAGFAGSRGISEPEAQHRTISEFMQTELSDVDGGVVVGFNYTPDATIAITGTDSLLNQPGRLGTYQADMPLLVGRHWLSLSFKRQGSNASTDVIERGDNTGFYAREGSASDSSGTGGIVLDEVHQAPRGSLPENLDFIARRRLDKTKIPPYEVTGTLPARYWFLVQCGDVFDSQHSVGPVELPGQHRCISKRLHPIEGLLEVTLQPLDFGRDLADDLSGLRKRVSAIERAPALYQSTPVISGNVSALLTYSSLGPGFVTFEGGEAGVARANGTSVVMGTPGLWQVSFGGTAFTVSFSIHVGAGVETVGAFVRDTASPYTVTLKVGRPGASFQFENGAACSGYAVAVLIQPAKGNLGA